MRLLVIVAAVGALQGVLLLLLIGVRYRGRQNIPLALLLFVFPLRLGTIPAWTPAGLLAAPWLFPLAGAAPLLFGPLVWWYTRELVREDISTPPYFALHLAPWFIETLALSALLISLDAAGIRTLVGDLFSEPAPW